MGVTAEDEVASARFADQNGAAAGLPPFSRSLHGKIMTDKPSASFASLFEAESEGARTKKARRVAVGDRVRAEVVQLGKDSIFLELLDRGSGPREQAYISSEELRGADGNCQVKVGDALEAVVVHVDAASREIRLGRSMGRASGLESLQQAQLAGVPVEGKVVGVNKGGLEVDLGGVQGFCPISQADRGYVADASALVGSVFSFMVTEVTDDGRRVVVSRRAALEEESRTRREQALAQLSVGSVLRGRVTAVRDFGAFVEVEGIEGLLPASELSYDRGVKVDAVLNPGEEIEVQVLELDRDARDKRGRPSPKLTLSLKALAGDPWERIDSVAQVGKVCAGNVVRVVDFGAFVRLSPGVEGLLHVSELGGKVTDASTALSVGDSLTVVVRSVDAAARKLSLTLAPEGAQVGTRPVGPDIIIGGLVRATVDRIEPYGVFVQLLGTRGRAGRGLIPSAELGAQRGADLRKLFPLGSEVTAKVLETGEGRLKLSIRAAREDEERALFDGFREKAQASQKLGTLGDLLKQRK